MQSALATRNQYLTQQRIQREALADLRRIWRDMPAGGDWNRAWERISPDLVGAVSQAQLKMATATTAFLDDFLAEVDLANRPTATVREGSLAGFTSDGADLDALLYGGVVNARIAGAESGLSARQALLEGLSWLGPVISSQISDAGRTATMLGTATRPNLSGYTRFLNPPSCQRCAVLAGRVYRYSTGFARHPRCDCIMQPAAGVEWAKAEGFVLDPTADLSVIKDLSRAQQAALESGADISQVVNARKGMSFVGEGDRRRQITTSGTSRRGVYGRAEIARSGEFNRGAARQQGAVSGYRLSYAKMARLTPQQIAKQARSREELIQYLDRYGYLNQNLHIAGVSTRASRAANPGGVLATKGRTADAAGGGRVPPKPPVGRSADTPDPDPSDKAAWKARQDAIDVDFKGEILEPHEVKFVERFTGAGNTVTWIAKDSTRHRPTNDFIWASNGGLVMELKSTKARFTTIRGRIQEAVWRAERQGVVKANFIIDLADQPLTAELRDALAGYNANRDKHHITRLWVMSEGRVEEIALRRK